jgi:ABC-type Fe3+/spermidine/putrescine transport system ATPase subunit
MAGPYLRLEELSKSFGRTPVTRGLSFDVEKSEIVALLGPSGSGKTTVLRLVAGFETPDSGRVFIEKEDVTAQPPGRRRFGMVFQHYALFPHMTVGENIAFGLESQGLAGEDVVRSVRETLAVVELPGFEERRVTQLSGGQQQRVALARALAPRPRVLLLDEPLSNLDPLLRERTRRELARVLRATGITALFVTHEQEEAFELGDRVAVLNAGRLEQIARPEDLYERPATRFVAGFIGRSSALPGTWEEGQPGGVRLANRRWPAAPGEPLSSGARIELLVRPEALTLARPDAPQSLPGRIVARRYLGKFSFFTVALEGLPEVEVLARSDAVRVDDVVGVVLVPDAPPPRAYLAEKP